MDSRILKKDRYGTGCGENGVFNSHCLEEVPEEPVETVVNYREEIQGSERHKDKTNSQSSSDSELMISSLRKAS